MIQIDDTIISLDVIEKFFMCDLAHCRGICCVEGESGAPLEKEELAQLEEVLPLIWDDLAPEAQEVIRRQGVAYVDADGDLVTSIVGGKNCVFTCSDAGGMCRCAIEKAYREGKTAFYKPVSCHLYPVRLTRYDDFTAVNYHRWEVCRMAEVLGRRQKMPVYRFLKEPLIRKFGEAWYRALEECVAELEKRRK